MSVLSFADITQWNWRIWMKRSNGRLMMCIACIAFTQENELPTRFDPCDDPTTIRSHYNELTTRLHNLFWKMRGAYWIEMNLHRMTTRTTRKKSIKATLGWCSCSISTTPCPLRWCLSSESLQIRDRGLRVTGNIIPGNELPSKTTWWIVQGDDLMLKLWNLAHDDQWTKKRNRRQKTWPAYALIHD